MDYNQFREEIVEQAQSGVITVEFEKADGSVRVLRGTLVESYIPEEKRAKGLREVNEEVVALFDLDKNDWRSFRLDSVLQIYFSHGLKIA